jgi:hypothetical protein
MTNIEKITEDITKLVEKYEDLTLENIVLDRDKVSVNIFTTTKIKSKFKASYPLKPIVITTDPYFYFMKCKRNSSINFEDIVVRFNISRRSLVLQNGHLDKNLTYNVSTLLYGLEFLMYHLVQEHSLKNNRDDKLILREIMEDIIHTDGIAFIEEMGEDLSERDFLEVTGDEAKEYAVNNYKGFINYTETHSWTSRSTKGGLNAIIVSREKYDYHYPIRTKFYVFIKYGKITHMEELK